MEVISKISRVRRGLLIKLSEILLFNNFQVEELIRSLRKKSQITRKEDKKGGISLVKK